MLQTLISYLLINQDYTSLMLIFNALLLPWRVLHDCHTNENKLNDKHQFLTQLLV